MISIKPGIDPDHLREYILVPTLHQINANSMEARQLLLCIAAHESHLGKYLKQLDGGPARGIYQMEPLTYNDVMLTAKKTWPDRYSKVSQLLSGTDILEPKYLSGNLYLATAAARLFFMRFEEPIPARDKHDTKEDWIRALGQYWKNLWNTSRGKGTVKAFMADWANLVKKEENG